MHDNEASSRTAFNGPVVAGNIGGSNNTGSVTGPVRITTTSSTPEIGEAIAQLRAELVALREQLAREPAGIAEPSDVSDVLDDLDDRSPDLPRAESRWARLSRRLPQHGLDLDTLTRITELFARIQELT